MSFFRHKRKKIKYENLAPKNDEIIVCEGFSLDAVNLFINNFVDPRDEKKATGRKLNFRLGGMSRSWDGVTTKARYQNENNFGEVDSRKNATFMRLKKKLENIKTFYPDVYYSKESVIELWARRKELYQINLEVLDYDRDSPAWMWI